MDKVVIYCDRLLESVFFVNFYWFYIWKVDMVVFDEIMKLFCVGGKFFWVVRIGKRYGFYVCKKKCM